MSTPILDLSYRNYDGPLEPPVYRWWAIAHASMRLSLKKKGFWVWSALSGYWYLCLIIGFYFVDNLTPVALDINGKNPILQQVIWKDQFLNAFSISQLLLFVLALLLGAGSIANDNRAKALLVYLSKPCTRLDYIVGKWFGIFLPLTVVTLIPTLLFYLYCSMTYRDYGFISDDPTLLFRLLLMCLLPGTLHASLCVGVSSLFDQGRLAGATYAGLYFIPVFLTKFMQIAHIIAASKSGVAPRWVDFCYYMSIDGLQIGLAKVILHTRGSTPFGAMSTNHRHDMNTSLSLINQPNGIAISAIFFGLCGLMVALAWSRVHAVEVVG